MRALILSAAALALVPVCAAAQTVPAPAKAAGTVAADPVRLAVARRVIDKLMPEGMYGNMVRESMRSGMDFAFDSMDELPIPEVMALGGLDADAAKALGETRIREILEIYDPHREKRIRALGDAYGEMLGDMMTEFEPKFREALALAYAREFEVAELTEMERFFSTPAGAHYAAKSLPIFMSPEVMQSMTEMMPELMKRMPDMMALVEAATADIPPARKLADLDPKDRARLAELLGVPEDKLTDPADDTAGEFPAETPH